MISKSKIDKLGIKICKNGLDEAALTDKENQIIDKWRQAHLEPLTEVTLKLQEWLQDLSPSICMAQRLKRKPQIIKKLKRTHPMRLSQMQDVGGCRAIFASNEDIEKAIDIIKNKSRYRFLNIVGQKDYRQNGRAESGYRAVHVIFDRNGYKIEMQLRTMVQHSWAEEVERTSIICQSSLKEGEGPAQVLAYFKTASDVLNCFDLNIQISSSDINKVNTERDKIRGIIDKERLHLLKGFKVNTNYLKSMKEKQKSLGKSKKMNNWILIFNWKEGLFNNWAHVSHKPEKAVEEYSYLESSWSLLDGHEVVMVSAKTIESIQRTHSHYFGVNSFDAYLKEIGITLEKVNDGIEITAEAKSIVRALDNNNIWGSSGLLLTEAIKSTVLDNISNPEIYLEELYLNDFLVGSISKGPIALNTKKKQFIEKYIL